jgi:DNA-directed RNA polymerase specialized sigma24 family protein
MSRVILLKFISREALDNSRRGQAKFLRTDVRVEHRGPPKSMMEISELAEREVVDAADSAAAVSRALAGLSGTDLLRLRALACLRAKGLPNGISWSDLLHEALARALDGSRRWPPGVPLLVFLAGTMRSICDEIWQRRRREAELIVFGKNAETECREVACPAADQERVLAASETLASLYRLFTGDGIVLRIISGLANGLSAADIRAALGLSPVEYDSARRRMRRALLRVGMSWTSP